MGKHLNSLRWKNAYVFTRSIIIDASPEQVFALIEDPEKRKLWQKGLQKTEYTYQPSGDDPVGTRFVAFIKEGHKIQQYPGELIEYEPGRKISLRMEVPHFTMTNTITLENIDLGTLILFQSTVNLHSFLAKMMFPLSRLFLPFIMAKQLSSLKHTAEQ